MPLGPGVRYRMKGNVRLAFKGGKVVEAKNMKTGKVHTPEEFAGEEKDETRNSEEFHGLMHKLHHNDKR